MQQRRPRSASRTPWQPADAAPFHGSLRKRLPLSGWLSANPSQKKVFSASASANSLLIRSKPEAGSRLATAPRSRTLDLSEPVVAGSQHVGGERPRLWRMAKSVYYYQ